MSYRDLWLGLIKRTVELKDPKDGEWRKQVNSMEVLHTISQNGTEVGENEAEETFKFFQSRLKS